MLIEQLKRFFKLPFLPIIIVPLILLSPLIMGGKALFWGTPSTQFVPWWDFAWDTIRSGQIPLWNPWVGMGAPLAANYQSALFYPPYWFHLIIYLVGGTEWMAWSLSFVVAFHLIWGGLGTSKILKDLGIGELGQTISGLTYAMGAYLVTRAGFLSINATASWLPWILLCAKSIPEKKSLSIIKTGFALGLMLLAGHAQTAWYGILLAGFWIIFWAIRSSPKAQIIRNVIKTIGNYLASGIIGIGISAVQLFPTFEYLLQSGRSAEYGFSEAMTYSFWPWRFLTLFVPDLFGNPRSGNYWGYGNYWEDSTYIGLLPIILVLGLVGQLLVKKRRDSSIKDQKFLMIFLFSIIGLSFLFALGKNTPIYPFLYHRVPTFDLFQAPSRYLIWAQIAMSILAGIAISKVKKPTGKQLYWTRLAVAGCAAISGASLLAGFYLEDIETTFISSIGLAGFLGMGAALLLLFKPAPNFEKQDRLWGNLVVGFVILDLLVAGWGMNPGIDKSFYSREERKIGDRRILMQSSIEYNLKFEEFFRFDSFEPRQDWINIYEHSLPNTALLSRIAAVNNFDPIQPARFQTWMQAIDGIDMTPNFTDQYLDLMAVSSLSIPDDSGNPEIVNLPGGGSKIIRIVYCSIYIENEAEILEGIISGKFDIRSEMIVNTGIEDSPGLCLTEDPGKARIIASNPGYLKIEVDLPVDGYIFWSQTWYPGWSYRIDNQKIGPVLRANYLFQGGVIPAGEHKVEFIYSPTSFKAGAILSIFTVLALVGRSIASTKKRV